MIELTRNSQISDRHKSRHRHAGTLERVREWWWNRDRRRHIREMEYRELRHVLDEDYVVNAFARQLEEIRNLPEFGL